MKIELTCPDCNSSIRVDDVHAGKQVRCPVCNCISQVPVAGEVVAKPAKPVMGDSATRTPISGLPDHVGNGRRRDRRTFDRKIFWAFFWATGAIANNFICCGSFVGMAFSLVGLVQAMGSKSIFRQSGVVVNLIALIISVVFQIFGIGFSIRL